MNNTNITISDRKKSLEANNAALAVKSVKVEYASNFSIKPLIDFFNWTFRRDTSNLSSKEIRENQLVGFSECDQSDATVANTGVEILQPDTLSDYGSFISC